MALRRNDGEEPRLASPIERYFRRDVSTARHWEPERSHKKFTAPWFRAQQSANQFLSFDLSLCRRW